jgi:hypothetical protein
MSKSMAASIRMPSFGARLKDQQLNILQQIVTKHQLDPALTEIASTNDFAMTSTERGVSHWEHGHLIAALDILNAYQGNRRAKSRIHMAGHRMGMRGTYMHDPRTRFVELLKRWLRAHAATTNLAEEEVRKMSCLCRDIMNHPDLFPARNERSFVQTIAEVYQHLDVQLRETLEHDRTCAELAQRVLSLSRNLVSNAIAYLLVGPTHLKRTDELPSLEVVSLWASLPTEGHPLPGRVDAKMQRAMKEVWLTQCGTLISNLLKTRWCVCLFEGAGVQEEAATTPRHAAIPDISSWIESCRVEFKGTSLKHSGLAGSFRKDDQLSVRMDYVAAVEVLVDLTYLIGEALVKFHRISDGLGDYGMICVATWLHPFLDALIEKVLRLRVLLENLKRAVDNHLIVAKSRGYAVEKPAPSQRMGQRAHLAIERAVVQSSSNVQMLLQAVEDLRQRSSPERLPQVVRGIGDACIQLDAVLSSQEFRSCVGDSFPDLPRIRDAALGRTSNEIQLDVRPQLQIRDATAPSLHSGVHSQAQILDVTRSEEGGAHSLHADELGHTPDEIGLHVRPPLQLLDATGFERGVAPNLHTDVHSQLQISDVTKAIRSAEKEEGFLQADKPSRLQDMMAAKVAEDSERQHWPLDVRRKPQDHLVEPISLCATVSRLTSLGCGAGFRRHDRRALRLHGDKLDIFEKSSVMKVKTVIDVQRDVQECVFFPCGKRLSLTIRRPTPGAEVDSGVWDIKSYCFEFAAVGEATAFHSEISRLRQL